MKTPVKVTLGILGGLFVIGLFAPGEDSETSKPATTNAPVATNAPAPIQADKEEVFLTMARNTYPVELAQVDDETLVSTALSTCNGLDSGMTMTQILTIAAESAVKNGLSDSYIEAMGGVIGYGVGVYCPEYAD